MYAIRSYYEPVVAEEAAYEEDELAEEEVAEEAPSDAPAPLHMPEAAREVAEDDFSRLFEKADAQLSGQESRRRISYNFV